MEHDTNQALRNTGNCDGGVIATVATLVAGMLASGKYAVGWNGDTLTGAALDDVVDTAVAIHLAAGKPFAELKADYDKRNAEHQAWRAGKDWSLGVPADVWEEVRNDVSKLDKDAMQKLATLDRQYREQRGFMYRHLVGSAADVTVNMKMPSPESRGESAGGV